MKKHKPNQSGLITMELIILIIIAVVVYLIYKQVLGAQK